MSFLRLARGQMSYYLLETGTIKCILLNREKNCLDNDDVVLKYISVLNIGKITDRPNF